MDKDKAIEIAQEQANINNKTYYIVKCCTGYTVLNEKKIKKSNKKAEAEVKPVPSI